MPRALLLLAVAAMLAACVPEAKVPVETLFYQDEGGVRADCLVVLVPGRSDRMGDFERLGFISSARQAGLKADLMAADLHIGYYMNRSAMHRLELDVVRPSLLKGYRKIWIVGISMGAMGAVYHEKDYPGKVSGIVLMAPFLGEDDLLSEIERAGGVLAWKPTAEDGEDYQQDLWAWIQKYARRRSSPQIYLAYGLQDRYARASNLLAAVLPPEHVIAQDGVHLWRTWRKLWDVVLARDILCNGD